MTYQGSCHCGAVAFTVEAPAPDKVTVCNCSHCHRKGLVLSFVPRNQFSVEQGHDDLDTYNFHKHVINHRFCRTCGTQAFAEGELNGTAMVAVNVRCVPEIDLDSVDIQKVDGASF